MEEIQVKSDEYACMQSKVLQSSCKEGVGRVEKSRESHLPYFQIPRIFHLGWAEGPCGKKI
jgi:hypothetical protein